MADDPPPLRPLAATSSPALPLPAEIPFLSLSLLKLVTFYFFLVALYIAYRYCCLRPQGFNMARSPVIILNAFVFALLTLVYAQNTTTNSSTPTTTSFRSIFTVPAAADVGQNLLPNINDPQAVNPQSVCPGYTASNVSQTAYGFTASLTLNGTACNVYGTDVQDLRLTVEYQSSDRLHVEITPTYTNASNSSWFELPEQLVPKPTIDATNGSVGVETDLQFSWSNTPTFSFTVTRRSTGDVLFTTNGTKLVFENQFIEFGSPLPENYNLYGLGEVIHGLRLGNNLTRTLYAADVGDPIDMNIYGDHPFYLDTRYFQVDKSTGNMTYAANATDMNATYQSYSHGVYLRNSHGMEILLRPSNMTWRTLGGNIDLYFYSGPTQDKVTKAYQLSAAGLPAMQQYFTFGFHQCRWGYKNWSELQDVVDNFAKFGIPLENIWNDIDYMNQYRDFENDQNTFNYSEGAKFLSQLHANGQHYIPIVDSAIYVPNPQNASDAYPIFDRGNATNSFMLNPDGSIYIGEVWPGYTVFPDWIGAALAGGGANDWWANELSMWHNNISFDGIWIDMSEVSSFCVGSCGSKNLTLNPVHPGFGLPGEPGNIIFDYPEGFASTNASEASLVAQASSIAAASVSSAAAAATSGQTAATSTSTSYLRTTPTPGVRDINYPPYVINNVQGDLAVHAVSPNATHHDKSVEYDYHNLFGHQILNATYHGLLKIFPSKRPFIIGRSTFVGSGKWAGHWGGDNASQFLYMLMSIPQALSFSLFGIPMFGVDTCGFNGNSDEELCNRWMQLSAFFPFYRNHNVLSAISQEPYVWASVAEASRKAMAIRYALLPYIYTTFYLSHSTGSTTMRALAWEWPTDPSLAAADRQFLLGPALMIIPVLNQGANTTSGVFPGTSSGTVWYDWYTQSAVSVSAGENKTLDAPLGHIPVFVRGGYILPMQEPAMTTMAARKTPWALLVALDRTGAAEGSVYVDDGESVTPNATLVVEFVASRRRLDVSPRGLYKDSNPLANVTVLGVGSMPTQVMFGGVVISSSSGGSGGNSTSGGGNSTSSGGGNSTAIATAGGGAGGGSWSYNSTSQVLAVTGLAGMTNSTTAWGSAWSLSWS